MIPKIIHYCWLSNDPMPAQLVECIKSWKREMPDYEIKLWNTKNFDIHCSKWTEDAFNLKKWAFACDYIRVYVLYHEGGVYFDSDVYVKKNIDECLENHFFSAIEAYPDIVEKIQFDGLIDEKGIKINPNVMIHGIQIQAAIMGSEVGHPFMKDCLDYYDSHKFEYKGSDDTGVISPIIFADIAVKYGFRYLNKEQSLDCGIKLYSVEKFAPNMDLATNKAWAIHCCAGSWRWMSGNGFGYKFQILKEYIKNLLYHLNLKDKKFRKTIQN